jgi:hypothetical protein
VNADGLQLHPDPVEWTEGAHYTTEPIDPSRIRRIAKTAAHAASGELCDESIYRSDSTPKGTIPLSIHVPSSPPQARYHNSAIDSPEQQRYQTHPNANDINDRHSNSLFGEVDNDHWQSNDNQSQRQYTNAFTSGGHKLSDDTNQIPANDYGDYVESSSHDSIGYHTITTSYIPSVMKGIPYAQRLKIGHRDFRKSFRQGVHHNGSHPPEKQSLGASEPLNVVRVPTPNGIAHGDQRVPIRYNAMEGTIYVGTPGGHHGELPRGKGHGQVDGGLWPEHNVAELYGGYGNDRDVIGQALGVDNVELANWHMNEDPQSAKWNFSNRGPNLDRTADWTPPLDLNDDRAIEQLRTDSRQDEHAPEYFGEDWNRGGCHYMTEMLDGLNGAERRAGYFVHPQKDSDGRQQAIDHYWLKMPNGSILDPTFDQFDLGISVGRFPPGHPMQNQYQEYAYHDPSWHQQYSHEIFDPEVAEKGYCLDCNRSPNEAHSSWVIRKTADKLHDFLMNPKSRPDLQTEEGQKFLQHLESVHNEKTDPLMPWLAREWKKGRYKTEGGLGREQLPYYDSDPFGIRTWVGPSVLNHWGDFLQAKRHPVRRELGDIMQLPIHEFNNRVHQWDDAMEKEAEEKVNEQAAQDGQIVHQWPDGYTMRKLNTPEELEHEGDAMGHCVGSYANQVANGSTSIYSLRDEKGQPHVTTEIEPHDHKKPIPENGEVVQIQGKANREPNDEYKHYMRQWFHAMPEHERPKWSRDAWDREAQHIMEPSEIDDYKHPGDRDEYGLEQPEATVYWDHLVEPDYRNADHYENARQVYNLAAQRGEIPELADEAQQRQEKTWDELTDLRDQHYQYENEYVGQHPEYEPEWEEMNPEERKKAEEEYQKRVDEFEDELAAEHGPSQYSNALFEHLVPHYNPQTNKYENEIYKSGQQQIPETFSSWQLT